MRDAKHEAQRSLSPRFFDGTTMPIPPLLTQASGRDHRIDLLSKYGVANAMQRYATV